MQNGLINAVTGFILKLNGLTGFINAAIFGRCHTCYTLKHTDKSGNTAKSGTVTDVDQGKIAADNQLLTITDTAVGYIICHTGIEITFEKAGDIFAAVEEMLRYIGD